MAPLAARAQAAEEREPAGYRAAIDAAVQEHELNHFAEAREHFARAHALYPNARTLRGLGVADFELRHYVDAVKELDAALGASTKRLDGTLRKDTEALLARARTYVGEIELGLEPAAATLHVDGSPTQPDPQGRLVLEVGDHLLELSAPGRVTQRRSVRITGQQRARLQVVLPEDTGAETTNVSEPLTPQTTADVPPEPAPRRRRVATWVLGGFTLAAAGAAVGLAVAVENTQESFEACIAANGLCQPLADDGTRLERARNAMIGVASAAAAATLVSFFVEGRNKRKAQMALRASPTGARLIATF
ncbi:MAG TPA: hypothetical protein VFZ61_33165 [Polyangiales bacterium]